MIDTENQLYLFLGEKKEDIIYKYQFVSRKGYSKEEVMSVTTENLNSAIDNKQNTCGIFLS